jgi:hypothetical protein
MYPVFRTRSYTYTRGRPRMRGPTRLRTHTRARPSAVAAAHNGPRRIDDRPRLSRLRWRAARAGKAANTWVKSVTAAVFHAPMSALNAEAYKNACEPSRPRSTPTGTRSHGSARMLWRPIPHAHARALTDAARGHVCAAGPHRRPVHRCSQPRMDVDSCMHCVYIHCVCACSIDGWPYEESAPHSRTCRALAHRHRPHAIARDRTRTQEHTRAPIYIPGLCVDIYIHLYTCTLDVCVGHIYRRTYPRTHVMATAASSARAIARTCAWEAVQPHARPYPSLTQVHRYVYTYV